MCVGVYARFLTDILIPVLSLIYCAISVAKLSRDTIQVGRFYGRNIRFLGGIGVICITSRGSTRTRIIQPCSLKNSSYRYTFTKSKLLVYYVEIIDKYVAKIVFLCTENNCLLIFQV